MRGSTQIVTRFPDGSARAISCSTELERGARGMVLLVDGVFRLDGAHMGGHCAFVSRPLNDGELTARDESQIESTIRGGHIELRRELRPRSFRFTVETRHDGGRTRADIVVGTVEIPERGTTRFTVQAIVRDIGSG